MFLVKKFGKAYFKEYVKLFTTTEYEEWKQTKKLQFNKTVLIASKVTDQNAKQKRLPLKTFRQLNANAP